MLCVRYYSKCFTHITHLRLRTIPWSWPYYHSCFINRDMEAHRTLESSPRSGAKNETQAGWFLYCIFCSFNHLLKLFSHSLQHYNKIPLLSIWLVVQLGFLLPACCYPSSVLGLRVTSTQGIEHLVLIFLPIETIFFPNLCALRRHVFPICTEVPKCANTVLTRPSKVWPCLSLISLGTTFFLTHFVPVTLASVSF